MNLKVTISFDNNQAVNLINKPFGDKSGLIRSLKYEIIIDMQMYTYP